MNARDFPTSEQIKAMLDVAVQAPSGHNYQPWSFTIKNDRLLVHLVSTDTTVYNFDERGSLVALGAIIESIALIAPAFEFEIRHQFVYNRKNPERHAVEIGFTRTARQPEPYAQALTSRTTNRKPYDDRPIPNSVRQAILQTLSETPTVRAYYVDDSNKRRVIARKLVVADALMLAHPNVYAAVFPHVVWTEQEEKERREGLYAKTLELPIPAERAFRFFGNHPRIARFAGLLGFGNVIATANADTYSHGGAFIYFTIPDLSDSSFFELGRAFLRVWTCATFHKLSAQPVGATIFLAARAREEKPSIFSPRTQTALMKAEETLKELFEAPSREVPGIVLRLGYAEPPSATSSRKGPRIQYL